MLNLSQRLSLQQKLTPQQVQYLQLLQLPILALEQRIKAELEMNPLLEEATEMEQLQENAEAKTTEAPEGAEAESRAESAADRESGEFSMEDYMNDESDGYKTGLARSEHEDREEYPQPAEQTLTQRLSDQISMLDLLERRTAPRR